MLEAMSDVMTKAPEYADPDRYSALGSELSLAT
jgi:hypothetical protein